MARTPDHQQTDGRETRAAIVRLTQDAHAAALLLAARCSRSWECDRRLTADEYECLGIDGRIEAGDREAIYDAIVLAVAELDRCRDEIGRLLADGTDALDRLAALRAGTDQETAGSDASGKERARGIARTAGRRPHARHG